MEKENISFLTIGYDPYSEVWPLFFHFFNKFVPAHYPSVFVTINEYKDKQNVGRFVFAESKSGSYSDRLKAGLAKIKTEYVVLLLDDFIISSPFNNSILEIIQKSIEEDSPDFIELDNFITKPKVNYKENKMIGSLKFNNRYRINLQPAIWKTSFLRTIADNELARPWDFEVYCHNLSLADSDYHKYKALFCRKKPFKTINAIDKGKYTRQFVRYLKISKLPFSGKMSIQSLFGEMKTKAKNILSAHTPNFIRKVIKRQKRNKYFTDD